VEPVQSEEEEHEEEDEETEQSDEARADSDSGSDVSLEDDTRPEDWEFVESDEEILSLNLPVKKKVFLRGPAGCPPLPYHASHYVLAPEGKL
jgi:hypothetical protein